MRKALLLKPHKNFNLKFYLRKLRDRKTEAFFKKFCSWYLVYSEEGKTLLDIFNDRIIEGFVWRIEEIDSVAEYIAKCIGEKTFGIFVEKKSSNLSSTEIKKILGAKIVEICGSRVNLKNPDVRVNLYICGKEIFTHLSS